MKIDIEAHNKLRRTSKQYKLPANTQANYQANFKLSEKIPHIDMDSSQRQTKLTNEYFQTPLMDSQSNIYQKEYKNFAGEGMPFKLKTALDDDADDRPYHNTKLTSVHSFRLYSLPTAELEMFKKDISCCSQFKKVEYEAHEHRGAWC